VQAARKSGPGAEPAYQISLQQLRSNGPEAVNVLLAGYRSTDPDDYGTRALLVEILAELREPEALPALTGIARTPVPPPVSGRNDLLNPFVEESVIRVIAIRGIGTIAAGDRQAQDTLLGLLGSNTAPVREEAARALWAASAQMEDRARQEAIRAHIPAELRVDPERKLGPIAPRGANPALRAATEKKTP
jgi:HEAT repeat protein